MSPTGRRSYYFSLLLNVFRQDDFSRHINFGAGHRAMEVPCHPFAELAHLCATHMPNGGGMLAMTYLGADEAVPHDGLMGHAVQKAPLQRLVTLDEIAQLCTFLASDASSGMTGQTIYVDGGCHAVA